MKKFKYFRWHDPNLGFGEGPPLIYIRADNIKEAKEKLARVYGFKHDPHFIDGDVKEVDEFTQPQKISII